MPTAAADTLSIAVALMALIQLGWLIVGAVVARRLIAEMAALRATATEAAGKVQRLTERLESLATDASSAVAQARAAAEQLGAVAGAGRSLVQSALGKALWRKLAASPRLARILGEGTVLSPSTVGSAAKLAMGVWRAVAARRRARRRASRPEPQPGGGAARPLLRTGPVRRAGAPRLDATPPTPSA